jgi:hypothetical protein
VISEHGLSRPPALELRDRAILTVEFPQSNARIRPASERQHAAIVRAA